MSATVRITQVPVVEITDPTKRYHMFNTGGVECEVGEFLYGLVRALHPQRVLSTGIHYGISDAYIGMALRDNGEGFTDSIETNGEFVRVASELWASLGVTDRIHPHIMPAENFVPEGEYELIWLDTEPLLRFAEFVRFFPHLAPGGFMGIHDLHRHLSQVGEVNGMKFWPYGELPSQMAEWLRSGAVTKFNLPTPRGLTMFYKPHMEDWR